jgi:hypothetical protein
MPALVDGDNVIYVLNAVRDGVPNFFSFYTTTTSGDYTVDLYNDTTTVTTHSSASQADFNLLYSKGTAEITEHGQDYKQIITKITGNFAVPTFYKKHASVSNSWSSPILSVKMASQTATSLSLALYSSTSVVLHKRLEEFEYVGDCNVTSLYYCFSAAMALGKVKGSFPDVTTAQSMFAGAGNVTDISELTFTTGTTNTIGMFGSSEITGYFNQDLFKGIDQPSGLFQNAKWILYFGTASTPIDFTAINHTNGFYLMFFGAVSLRHAYFQNCAPKKINLCFYNTYSLETISGINCANVTDTTTAFYKCYSLSTLEISNMPISFSLEDCNFNRAGLVNVFNDLPSVSATITVTDNPGTSSLDADDLAIATDKGWTVTT